MPGSPKNNFMARRSSFLGDRFDSVVTHMNEDHGDSVLAYVHHYAARSTATNVSGEAEALRAATGARLVDLSSAGMAIEAVLPDGASLVGTTTVFVPFIEPLASPKDVRPMVVRMHHEAFAALGFAYRLRTGYLKKQVVEGAKNRKLLLAAAGVVVVGAAVYLARQKSVPNIMMELRTSRSTRPQR